MDVVLPPEAQVIADPMIPAAAIKRCSDIEGLAALDQPGTELVIWRRALSPDLRDWLTGLDVDCLPDLRILVRPDDLKDALAPMLEESGMTEPAMRDLLIADIQGLVHTFAAVTESDHVDVRLERIDHNACWKFHRDHVAARLVTTYLGPSTEWVPMDQGERAIIDQQSYDGPLERLGDHDVAFFKGLSAGAEHGVVHRSPPIEGTGETRLLLCLNQQTVVSPEPWVRPRRLLVSSHARKNRR